MPRRGVLLVGLAAVVVAGSGAAWAAGIIPPRAPASAAAASPGGAVAANAASSGGASPTTPQGVRTAAIERRTLTISQKLNGTLGYEGAASIPGQLRGTLTWLPDEGAELGRGSRLYETDGRNRAILMLGARPAWRTLARGVTNGADVEQLEANLKALGYAVKGLTVDRHWDSKTTASVKRWQRKNHLPVDGRVDLGEVVFLPTAIRVTARPAPLGSPSGGGSPVLSGTTPRRIVTVALAAADRELLAAGAAVTVELPDGSMTGGHVATVGRVAHAGSDNGFGSTSPATIDVVIALDDAAAGAAYDGAPVTVRVVTSSRPDVLAVPVRALVALLEGGYAVEVQAADGSHRYVAVKPGLFQDGWVEITGTGLQPGDLVVVAS